jgi:hypothetical protein
MRQLANTPGNGCEQQAFWREKRWACLILVWSLLGCSNKTAVQTLNSTETKLTKIGMAYNSACNRLGRAPDGIEEIKQDFKGGFSDDLLRSPNDGQDFVILWGVDYNSLPPRPSDPFTIGIYEKTGVSGKRYVLRFPLGVVVMTEADFRKASFPPGHQPPP